MESQQPKKRVRHSSSNQNGNQSPPIRGRPRLNIAPENSKERRRAQIRQAQRAYRGRKEDAIATLSQRVESLQSVIGEMSDTFAAFESSALGASTEFREQIRRTAEQMAALAAKGVDGAEVVTSPGSAGRRSSGQEESSADACTPDEVGARQHEQLRPVTSASGDVHPSLRAGVKRSHVMVETENDQNANTNASSTLASQPIALQTRPRPQSAGQQSTAQSLTCPDADDSTITPQMLDTLSIPLNLIPPQDYSHLETSFTRRLLRSALGAAQRLLRDPHADPVQLHRLARYAMCYMKRTRMAAWFNQVWSRPANTNLETWFAPVYHIGNAGLHYPRAGIDAGSLRPPQWDHPGRIGPPSLIPTDRPEARHLSKAQTVQYAEVGGEWYDSNDVEEYLKTMGIFLDATSSVVEVVDNEAPGLVSGSSNGTSISQSTAGPSSPSTHGGEAAEQLKSTPFGPYWSMDEDFGTQVVDSRVQNFGFDFTLPGTMGMRSKKIIDVEAFVGDLVNRSTCLGRTLGFRKDSIDTALQSATTRIPVHG